jgi:hypothetical protein
MLTRTSGQSNTTNSGADSLTTFKTTAICVRGATVHQDGLVFGKVVPVLSQVDSKIRLSIINTKLKGLYRVGQSDLLYEPKLLCSALACYFLTSMY